VGSVDNFIGYSDGAASLYGWSVDNAVQQDRLYQQIKANNNSASSSAVLGSTRVGGKVIDFGGTTRSVGGLIAPWFSGAHPTESASVDDQFLLALWQTT